MNALLSLFLTFTIVQVGFTELSAQGAEDLVESGLRKVESGDHQEALAFYNQAIEANPELMDAYLKRAFVFSILKKYEEAIEDYSKLIALNPKLVLAYLSRGSAYNKLEKFELAIQDFEEVMALDPDNSEAYNNRGWAKKGMGDKDGACKDWKRSKRMGNEEAKIILKNNQC